MCKENHYVLSCKLRKGTPKEILEGVGNITWGENCLGTFTEYSITKNGMNKNYSLQTGAEAVEQPEFVMPVFDEDQLLDVLESFEDDNDA